LEEKYDGNLRDSDDSSDEENLLRNGNVPQKWYDLYDHKGYSIDGKTVGKMLEKDELQKFVEKQEDPQWWRNITDDLNNKEIRLSRADLDMILRIRKGKVADKNFDVNNDDNYFEYEHKDFIHPFGPHYEPKRRFVPSKWERLKIQKFIKAIREGRMKTLEQKKKEKEDRLKE
jgi:ribosome biogenesis protein ERB1